MHACSSFSTETTLIPTGAYLDAGEVKKGFMWINQEPNENKGIAQWLSLPIAFFFAAWVFATASASSFLPSVWWGFTPRSIGSL